MKVQYMYNDINNKMMTDNSQFFFIRKSAYRSGTCKLTDFAMYPLSILY